MASTYFILSNALVVDHLVLFEVRHVGESRLLGARELLIQVGHLGRKKKREERTGGKVRTYPVEDDH